MAMIMKVRYVVTMTWGKNDFEGGVLAQFYTFELSCRGWLGKSVKPTWTSNGLKARAM